MHTGPLTEEAGVVSGGEGLNIRTVGEDVFRRVNFELIPGRRTFVRRRVGERYHPDWNEPTAKHGGKIQVWGWMAGNGFGSHKVVNGRLDAAAYVRLICRILEKDGESCEAETLSSNKMGLHVTEQIGPSPGLRGKGYQLAHGHHRALT